MTKRLQSEAAARAHPLWVRWVALCCVWLVFAAAVAQAAHVHGDLLSHGKTHVGPHSGASQTQNSGEEHCQLCQAMHTAMPAITVVGVLSAPVVRTLLAVDRICGTEGAWQFAMFSRPPPAIG